MNTANTTQANDNYWEREGLGQAILDALHASGKHLQALTIDDLAPLDQFHGGGKAATVQLARRADLQPGTRVLDVGGGLGGPARTLAVEFGCHVSVIDSTVSYVQVGAMLTAQLGLTDHVSHRVGSALALPFENSVFDVVWTQNSGMNIADKEQLYAGFHRVLRPGGLLVFQEPMAGPAQPLVFPTMWAQDASTSFLQTNDEIRMLIEATGFQMQVWAVITATPTINANPAPAQTIADLVMGDNIAAIDYANQRNRDESRVVIVQAVFERL